MTSRTPVRRVPIPIYNSSTESPPSDVVPSTPSRTLTSNLNPNMSTFRPQGRLPLDPFNGATTEADTSSSDTTSGYGSGKGKGKGRSFHWTVKEEDIQGIWQDRQLGLGKVILILGAPSERDLSPLLSSRLLSKSLLIVATEHPPLIASHLSPHGPAVVILRLQRYTLFGPSAQQQLHSILIRAGDIAKRWRMDPNSFFGSDSMRGRLKQRKQAHTEAVQIMALQFSELGDVFGGDFVVKEEVGYDPDPKIASKLSTLPTSVKKSSSSKKTQSRDQCCFEALINFVPTAAMDEETLLGSISLVSLTSRFFLSASTRDNSSDDRRGRSVSKGSRGRSSSLDRIKKWMSRSRSRSKTRNRSNSKVRFTVWNSKSKTNMPNIKHESDLNITLSNTAVVASESSDLGKGKCKGQEVVRDQDVDGVKTSSPSPSTPPPSPLTTLEGKDLHYEAPPKKPNSRWSIVPDTTQKKTRAATRATTGSPPQHISGKVPTKGTENTQRAERSVLASWSRNQLEHANRAVENKTQAAPHDHDRDAHSDVSESKAYLVHVLPISLPSRNTLMDASFAPSRQSTLHSSSHLSALSSSSETTLSGTTLRRRELRDSGVLHQVPPALKSDSIKSSMAIALTTKPPKRGASLDSMIASLPKSESQKTQSTTEDKTLSEKSDCSSEKTQFSSAIDHAMASSSLGHQINLDSQHFRRRALSPAVTAAVESATRHSIHASSRALSMSGIDMGLRRQSTALQVASAAAMAAMEVHYAKATQLLDGSKQSQSLETEDGHSRTAEDSNEGEGSARGRTHTPAGYRPSTLSMGIPNTLMPFPHRQSFVLDSHDSSATRANPALRSGSPESGAKKSKADYAPPTPIALLPRPHARARTLSLEQGISSPLPSNRSSRSTSPFTIVPSSNLSSSDPNSYYEKTQLLQTTEGFLLSYSYAPSPSPASSIPSLPKGAAKPSTIGGAAKWARSSRKAPLQNPTETLTNLQKKSSTPVSYLLPQGLLDLSFRMPLEPDTLMFSIADLILHGLLDPSSESIALYRDALSLAATMNPADRGFDNSGNITLNGLMALGALNGEGAGVAHSMPRAWIGGIADIDVRGATSEPFNTEGMKSVPVAQNSHAIPPPLSIIPQSLSAVSLHSMTVALSPVEASSLGPDSPHFRSTSREGDHSQPPSVTPLAPFYTFTSKLNVDGLRSGEDDGWKRFVKEIIHTEKEGTEPESNRLSDSSNKPIRPSIVTTQTSPAPYDIVRSRPLLARTATSPELPSSTSTTITPKAQKFHIPAGAALPTNPHLPNTYSSFPRHSVMFPVPPNFNLAAPSSLDRSMTSTSAEPEVDEAASVTDVLEDIPVSSDLESKFTALESALSSIHLSDETDPTGSVIAVDSDNNSDIVLPGTTGLLLEKELSSPSFDDASILGITVELKAVDSSKSTISTASTSSSPERASKIWLERSPRPIEQIAKAPSQGSIDASKGNGSHPSGSTRESNPESSINSDNEPLRATCFESTVRRRSTVPNKRSSTTNEFEGVIRTAQSERLSKATSWVEIDLNSSNSTDLEASLTDIASISLASSSLPLALGSEDKESTINGISAVEEPHSEPPSSSFDTVAPSSPHLSSLSLSLNNLSTRSESSLNPATSVSMTTFAGGTHPGQLAVVHRRLSPSSSPSVSRRNSTGAPIGPRAPKRSGSLRRPISPGSSGPSPLSSVSESTESSIRRRPLPLPKSELICSSTAQLLDEAGAQLALISSDRENQVGISSTMPSSPPPTHMLANVPSIGDLNLMNQSRPTSRPSSRSRSPTPTAFTPLRRPGLDEVCMPSDISIEDGHSDGTRAGLLELTKVVSRGGINTNSTPRPSRIVSAGPRISFAGVGVEADKPAKPKWKFWSPGGRPMSVMVDLSKD